MPDSRSADSSEPETAPGGSTNDRDHPETSVWEWVAGFVGLVLVIGSVGFLLFRATGDTSPPNIVVLTGAVRSVENGYLVPFRLRNRGGSTAEGVIVEGQLKEDGRTVESSETTVTFVPSHSERKGGLFFTKSPREYDLELRATGYQEP